MSFGVHLLVKGLAKSDTEVLKILQSHVDEMDGFLERTSEDFLIIQLDLRTRIEYLSLPLRNLDVFDGMLADRSFRSAMIGYNDLIEHAIGRFSLAVQDALKDIYKGKEAVRALWHYLWQSATENVPLPSHLQAVYDSMAANLEGWNNTFSRLRKKGTTLESALVQLGRAVTEMQRRVGVASRKDMLRTRHHLSHKISLDPNLQQVSSVYSSQNPPPSRFLRERFFEKGPSLAVSSRSLSDKPLPHDPGISRPGSSPGVARQTGSRRMTRKSVPNLKSAKTPDSQTTATTVSGRARSANGAVEMDGGHTDSVVPKIQRSLSRKLSRAMLPKRTVSEDCVTTQNRHTAERSNTLKSRSISLDRLKNPRASNKDTPAPEVPPAPPVEATIPSRPSTRQESMKDQILHYFKTDQVADAWETTEKKEKKITRRASLRMKDGPLSVFRKRSSNALRTSERPQSAVPFEKDLDRQMAWLQEETAALNTYSLKPKRDVSPRIHVLDVQSDLTKEEIGEGNEGPDNNTGETCTAKGDAESLITALPSVPLPPVRTPFLSLFPCKFEILTVNRSLKSALLLQHLVLQAEATNGHTPNIHYTETPA